MAIEIYRTTNVWFVLYEHPNCTQIEFIIPEEELKEEIKRPETIKIDNWPEGKGDGNLYKVPLGNPIISFSAKDLEEYDLISERKKVLKRYRELEMVNIMYRKQGIKHFQWIPQNITNKQYDISAFMYYGIFGQDISPEIRSSILPSLISLLFQLEHHKPESQELRDLKTFMKHLPYNEIFRQLKGQHPKAFDWVE